MLTTTLYHKTLKKELDNLAKNDKTIFIGQQVASIENFYNLLIDIPMHQKRELPVAEDMQTSMCLGMALEGFLPISIYQRCDFLPRAADSLINHLNLIEELSRGVFCPKIIIFTTIGSKKPIDTGLQHSKNLIDGFRLLLTNISIFDLQTVEDIQKAFKFIPQTNKSLMLVARQENFYE